MEEFDTDRPRQNMIKFSKIKEKMPKNIQWRNQDLDL